MILTDPAARPVIAHRGGRARAPENTLVAFEQALVAGADAFEFDVRLTADGHVVVCHDATVNRTTDGRGAIADLSLAAIRELDAGARWSAHPNPEWANRGVRGAVRPFAGKGHGIPLLTEVLDAFPDTPVIIECKTREVAAPATSIVIEHGARARTIIGAFDQATLAPPRAAGIGTTASHPELMQLLSTALLRRRARTPVPFSLVAMSPSRRGIPLPVRGFVHALDVPVHVWTINNPAAATKYWNRGVRGIITDDPAAMVAARTSIAPLRT